MTTGHTCGEAVIVLKDGLQISRASAPSMMIYYETLPAGSRIIVTQSNGGPVSLWEPTEDDLAARDWRIHN